MTQAFKLAYDAVNPQHIAKGLLGKFMKYKLNVSRDVDTDDGVYILNLPHGFRLDETDLCHTMGFDSMRELRQYAKDSVIPCTCDGCVRSA